MVLEDFRSRVAQAPDAIAVEDGSRGLTYLDLARHASGLAARLAKRGIGPDAVVAVYAGRSAERVVAELGVLLAGAAFLSLDPAGPAARTSELLALSGAPVVVSTGPLAAGGAPLGDAPDIVDLTEVPPSTVAWIVPDAASLAYVSFAAQPSGRPRGIMVSHGGLAHLVRWYHRCCPPRPGDRTTLFDGPGYPWTVLDTWPTLAAGGTLVVPGEVPALPSALVGWLVGRQVTRTFLATPVAEAVLAEPWPDHAALRHLVTGGLAMRRAVPDGLPFAVVNLYGPVEGAAAGTAAPVRPGDPVPPAIGQPLDGVRWYVLDGFDPVPDGQPGELCLAGDGVARGFLGSPGASASAFVPDLHVPGRRMYRTGDRVRRRADGTFEYLGRLDDRADRSPRTVARPDRVTSGPTGPYRTPTEAVVAAIVAELIGLDRVGPDDDFFALGGTSLMLWQLETRLEERLDVTVSLFELLDARTVGAVAAIIDQRDTTATGVPVPASRRDTGSPPAPPPLVRARRDGPVPLTPPQERLWFLEQLAPGNLAYNIQMSVSLHGRLDVTALRAALDEIVRRHEILRTAFVTVDGVVQQRLVAMDRAPLQVLEVAAADAETVIAERVRRPFNLAQPPLAEYLLLRHGPEHATLLVRAHHIIHDGWSFAVFLSELRVHYAAYLAGRPAPLPALALQYPDVAVWQRSWMQGEVLRAHLDHWTGVLAGAPYVLELPTDRPRPPVLTFRGAAPHIRVPAELSQALRGFSREHRVSLFATMTAGFAALLHRYTGQQDLLVGTGVASRSLPELEPLLGMFVNTLVLRARVPGQVRFTDLLDQVHRRVVDTLVWSDTPVDAVIPALGIPRDPSRTPLFQVMFSFHDYAVPDLEFGGLTGTVTERANGSAKTDLNVIVIPRAAQRLGRESRPEDDDLTLVWEYATDLFDEDTMSRMAQHYLGLLTDALARPAVRIDELRLMDGAQVRQLESWSRAAVPAAPAPATRATIPALFAAQVARRPDATALIFGRTSLTYRDLDRRSNALAWLLHRRGVGPDTTVGVAIERGPDLVVALLAVLKAGGAYLPIDTGSPAPRVAAMMAAAGAGLLLVASSTAGTVPVLAGVHRISVDAEPAGPVDRDDERAAPPDTAYPSSLAYVSFTSGSTGVPKGVAIPHRAVVRLVRDPTFVALGPGQRLLHLAPVAFDASTLEIWGALLTGAEVVLAPPGPLGLADVAALLRTSGATIVWLTAGLFHQMAEADIDALADVPVLLSGGDALDPDTVRAVLAVRSGRPLVNGYGPTENTTFTTCHVMTDASQSGPSVPIGRPIQHTTVYVLDEQARPVPVGVTGELYTGGDGLARGYVGSAAATARSFVPDPFGHGTRLYRTGDLVRWRADGTLQFVGRVDDQVKIRGYRVEPGEVSAVLRAHPAVREAVVVVAGTGAQRHLVGYVTPAQGVDPGALSPVALRDFLADRLPEYLVPTGFTVLPRLPLNANGKVDRAALPAPERYADGPVTPPRGATEQRVVEVWRRLLPADSGGAGEIDRMDSFFALGGNSLLAARLMFRIGEAFGVEIPMATFYQTPTVAALAAAVDAATPVDQVDLGAPPPAPAASGIVRRDRSAYRKGGASPPPDRPTELAPHLVRLTDNWALWRTVCLRGTGLPIHLLAAAADTGLAQAADAVLTAGADPQAAAGREQADAAYAAEFAAAARRLSASLYDAARLPKLREAVAWQNRHALTTGIDVLVRRGPQPRRNGPHRQHESLVMSYLQRYCAKNDTIGFFGPVGWSQFDEGQGIRITQPAPGQELAARSTYLEGWAFRAFMAQHASALRPWLVPRRMPFVGFDGTTLRPPMAPAIPLSAAEAAVLRSCDDVRDARTVAEVALADPAGGLHEAAEVFAVLARLADSHRLAWQVDVAPQDIRPERAIRTLLARVTDDSVREPIEKALDELAAARDELASAGGDAERVADAIAGLETTFTRLSGLPPTRRAGELYAGRTLAFEECLRGGTVRFGTDTLDGVKDALALVLDAARWFVSACGATYAQKLEEVYRQRVAALGTDVVPFADVWLLGNDILFSDPPWPIGPVMDMLRQRWSAVLDLPPDGARRVELRSADLREQMSVQFPAQPRPWPTAVHHSPDLMIAGDRTADGRLTWVLGEVHPSVLTLRYSTWLELHHDPDAMRAAIRHDLNGTVVWLAETAEVHGSCMRLSNVAASPDDLRLVFAHDSCGYDPGVALKVADCDVVDSPNGLRVRQRDGTHERSLAEVIGDLVAGVTSGSFDLMPTGEHTPRVTIDDLVVCRERWKLDAAEPTFAYTADESTRYVQARAWAARHGMPRYLFLRFTGEKKPIYADLTSLASIDMISRSIRRARRVAGADATVTAVEMVPTPDQTWLTDAQGHRYSAELRMVVVDQRPVHRNEG